MWILLITMKHCPKHYFSQLRTKILWRRHRILFNQSLQIMSLNWYRYQLLTNRTLSRGTFLKQENVLAHQVLLLMDLRRKSQSHRPFQHISNVQFAQKKVEKWFSMTIFMITEIMWSKFIQNVIYVTVVLIMHHLILISKDIHKMFTHRPSKVLDLTALYATYHTLVWISWISISIFIIVINYNFVFKLWNNTKNTWYYIKQLFESHSKFG